MLELKIEHIFIRFLLSLLIDLKKKYDMLPLHDIIIDRTNNY
jgi:hypothetical protein